MMNNLFFFPFVAYAKKLFHWVEKSAYRVLISVSTMSTEKSVTEGIGESISQIEQVISSSLRPMPTETGDGTYIKQPKTTGLAKDIVHVDLEDVKTLVDVTKTGATGQPVDDREYIMERVIQVSILFVSE